MDWCPAVRPRTSKKQKTAALKPASLLRVAIVDDSPEDRLNLRTLLQRLPGYDVVGEAGSLDDARALLGKHAVDVLFLDIELGPKQSGFSLLETLPRSTKVVFTTVHRNFGPEAFDFGATDYIVKPVTEDRLLRAVGRLGSGIAERRVEQVAVYRSGTPRHSIALDTVAAVLGDGDYTRVYSGAREYLDKRRLREWQELLEGRAFEQLDRSTLVQLGQVVSWQPMGRGGVLTLRQTTMPLELGRTAFLRFNELIGER